jgi:3-hydroxyisobutyrate dehydrogenase-like beta-hydroxyacid dehydrogenase
VILDILPRRYAEHLGKLPSAAEARVALAATVLRSAREISAADLAAVIGGPREEAAAALDRLANMGNARARDGGEYTLWMAV